MAIVENSLIIIPTDESYEKVCDFALQTSRILAKNNNLVLIYPFASGKSIKEIIVDLFKKDFHLLCKKEDVYYFNKIEILPFKRLYFIHRINLLINILFLKIVLLFLKKRPKKKIIWLFHP